MKTKLLRKLRRKYNWQWTEHGFVQILPGKMAYPLGKTTFYSLSMILRDYSPWSLLGKYTERRRNVDNINTAKQLYAQINDKTTS